MLIVQVFKVIFFEKERVISISYATNMTKLKQNTCYTNVAVPFSSDLKHTENI